MRINNLHALTFAITASEKMSASVSTSVSTCLFCEVQLNKKFILRNDANSHVLSVWLSFAEKLIGGRSAGELFSREA